MSNTQSKKGLSSRLKVQCLLCAFLLSLSPLPALSEASSPQAQIVTYPVLGIEKDKRDRFVHDLLKLIFKEQYPYILRPTSMKRENAKLIHLVVRKQVDIGWASALSDNYNIRAIPYPIYRGLLGYRLVIVTRESKDILANVKNLGQFRRYSIGQGKNWAEVELFRKNGLRVITSSGYEDLFNMLKLNRFDLFPRSILEISEEMETFSNGKLVIDEHLLLQYQLAIYFYVTSENRALAAFMEKRLNELTLSGGFDTLFQQHYAHRIAAFSFDGRKVIRIPNASFPKVPAQQKSLYLTPQQLKKSLQ